MRGFVKRDDLELVVIDTPGIQEGTKALNAALARNAIRALKNASEGGEVIAFCIDSKQTLEYLRAREKDANLVDRQYEVLARILDREKFPIPLYIHLIPTLTKSDLVTRIEDRKLIEEHVNTYVNKFSKKTHKPIWISSKTYEGNEEWLNEVANCLPLDVPGKLFNVDDLTDKSLRQIVAEYIREQCFLQLQDEIPYSIAVVVETFDESRPNLTRIEATLYVERDSQKAIVIGKEGKTLKNIGIKAREKIERLLQKQVFLGLKVKVAPHWSKELSQVKRFGYEET